MVEAIFINSTQNLPEESTLLIYYTITQTGNWDLVQNYTAYRNVCDDYWTVMYPNFQHPLHSDFPILVTDPSFNGIFAWNYGGIRGISSENFDDNHSYLTQITIYNLDCYYTGQTGVIVTGQTGITGNPEITGSRNNRPRPYPRPGPPRPPDPPPPGPPGSVPPRPPLVIPGVIPNPTPPKGPGDPPPPGRRNPITGRTPINTIRPELPRDRVQRPTGIFGIEDGYRNNTRIRWDSIGIGSIEENRNTGPIFRNRGSLEIDNRVYEPPVRRTRDLNYSIEDYSRGNYPRPSISFTQGNILDIGENIMQNNSPGSSSNLYITKINSTNQASDIISINKDTILQEAETRLEVGKTTIFLGERIVLSGLFKYSAGTVKAYATIVAISVSGNKNIVYESTLQEITSSTPLVLGTSITSHQYTDGCILCMIVKDSDGSVIGVDSKIITIVSNKGTVQQRQAINYNFLPDILKNYTNTDDYNYIDLDFYQNETKLINLEDNSAGYLESVLLSETTQAFSISLYNTENIPESLDITSSSKLVRNNQEILPEAYNTYIKSTNPNIPSYSIRISPRDNNLDYHKAKLYISKNYKKKVPTTTFLSYNGSTATVSFSCCYGSEDILLIVNGNERGKYNSSSYTQEKTTTDSGGATFTSVSITKGMWVSFVLKVRGKYSLSKNLVYEVQFN